MSEHSYDRRIVPGAKVFLTGHAISSRKGFSVQVEVVRLLERPKGLRALKQEVEIRLPGGDIEVFEIGDLAAF